MATLHEQKSLFIHKNALPMEGAVNCCCLIIYLQGEPIRTNGLRDKDFELTDFQHWGRVTYLSKIEYELVCD